jgi:glycosyltransferase involved in cell wall biosynthesis
MQVSTHMKNKPKLLCILHYSPPAHGASKVGDFIKSSKQLQEKFDCRFIKIKSSDTIGDIGKINLKKIYFVIELFFKILFTLITFRPQKIYFTASIRGIALYRDILLSTLWKCYKLFKKVDIYYHYHTKGVNTFVSIQDRNLKLTSFFLKDVNIILLSPLLQQDLQQLNSYKQIFFLSNGIEDNMKNENFKEYITIKYQDIKTIKILYLAHMMKEKGYWEVLRLAKVTKNQNIHYHFAGSWKDKKDEKDFFQFIKKYQLKNITYHGFISGKEKNTLFQQSHLLIYPSKNDAFPLTLLEALSYGLPILASNEGSIAYILDKSSGIIFSEPNILLQGVEKSIKNLINYNTAMYCRQRYLNNFTLNQFEKKLLEVLE